MSDRLIADLYPSLQPLCQMFLSNCKAAGINAFITETWRSAVEQDADFARGRTLPGNIITNAKGGESPHNCTLPDGKPGAKAFDFAILGNNGVIDWNADDAAWKEVISIGQALGLVSGSQFHSLKDSPHMEMPHWATTSSLLLAQKTVIIPVNTTHNQGISMLSGWKTIVFSIATIILGVLQSTDVTTIIAQHPGGITTGIGVLTMLLRLITSTPPGINVSFAKNTPVAAPITPAP